MAPTEEFTQDLDPFGTPTNEEELEEGNAHIHCSNCFENREEFVST